MSSNESRIDRLIERQDEIRGKLSTLEEIARENKIKIFDLQIELKGIHLELEGHQKRITEKERPASLNWRQFAIIIGSTGTVVAILAVILRLLHIL